MKNSKTGAFGIAMTFTGTLIGAGFASGQEILRFFAAFGIEGVLSTGMVSLCFCFLGIVIMLTARNLNTSAYEAVISANGGVQIFINILISVFSFGVITVMLAGAGSLWEAAVGGNPLTGSVIMCTAVAVVAMFGSEGLVNSFSVVVPVMAVIAVIAAVWGIATGEELLSEAVVHPELAAADSWALSGLLFISYNTICAVAVLVPLGCEARNRKSIVGGSLLGGVILGGITTLLCISVLKNFQSSHGADMPLYEISLTIHPVLGHAYTFVLFAAIFTTAAGLMYALSTRFNQYVRHVEGGKIMIVAALSALALLGSRAGFTMLIRILYPITGYLGFFIIVCLICRYFRSKKKIWVYDSTIHKFR